MFSFESKGDFSDTEKWLKDMARGVIFERLSHFGAEGVAALSAATPVESGETASSWYYEIIQDANSWSIVWGNTHVEDGKPIAVLLDLGHGTRTGGYVQGRNYINPAMQPIFDRMAQEAWKVVTA